MRDVPKRRTPRLRVAGSLIALALVLAAPPRSAAPAEASIAPRPALMAPLAETSILLSVARAGDRLVAVGQRGYILLSDDGKSWRQVPSPVDVMLNRVRFRDARMGWAVGHDAAILGTRDAGETWSVQHYGGEGRPLYDVIFHTDSRVTVIGGYGSYLVSDDGTTWTQQDHPLAALAQHLNAAARLADGTLLIAGERGLLARSRDDGVSWDLLGSPYTGSFFGALPFGGKGALVYGLRGNVYVAGDVSAAPTVDPETYDPYERETVTDAAALAELGWRPLETPTTESLFGGAADGAQMLLVGVNGVALRVDPGAGTARHVDTSARQTLSDLLRHGDGWIAVGRRGVRPLGALP